MDNVKFVLFAALAFLAYLLWQAWQEDYGPKPPTQVQNETSAPAQTPYTDVPETAAGAEDIPESTKAAPKPAEQKSERISVITDVLKLEIDTAGGNIRTLDLLDYPVSKDQPNSPVRLLTDKNPELFITQGGFLSSDDAAPNHHSRWRANSTHYELKPDQKILQVPLTWTNDQGIRVTKTFIFERGNYLINLEYTVSNQSQDIWRGRLYGQLKRKEPTASNGSAFIRTYTGGVLYSDEEKYEKISFGNMKDANLSRSIKDGWSAMIQHYFLAAWLPPEGQVNHFYTKALPESTFVIGSYSPQQEVKPGEQKEFKARLFIGPKLQHMLEETAPGLELTVDYGVLTLIAKPIFWLLEQFHKFFNNWGWAIVGVTIVIKLLFFKLSETSYRSMANMRKLQPRMKALKERFGDDKQKFNQALMDLYRKERVNPLGGCLPILVQIPVFISLYWVLVESVELRQAPFFLWIDDLSARDPYFILPLLMGVTMYAQQKLNPTPVDPIQEKVMKLFPFIFTVFFAFFPAGLVLYWVVNNTLSIVQQWYITRRIEVGEKAKA